ncbi:hypothetical protein PGT21_022661 [Puccinia graminis f. sp. tritici]|uniref:Uncharacterized protein n=2 Tax=Puccinia graminis f. sp. tritici TaxID=56615 RepID=E3KNK1_PUCGT|nr:uncharacterized protein PGTG_11632 [Puccinia graminis f. sp. tritici CRL 75-36-700-3]EFP85876.2 hypothetical protein PGTG_11632 [Puccinia graminis f. sp. tritici CRL 75-36-700-3]KAA1076869.1 hypothetical protein PGT21_022661 [Puccinia graminis f. sp. tritici]
MASNMNRERLKIAIKWGVSTFFLICAFGPIPFISWLYTQAYRDLHKIETVIHSVAAKLRAEGKTYDPTNFHSFKLLSLLLPASDLAPLNDRLKSALTTSTVIYCMIITCLISIYIPLLTISLRALYKQSVSQAKIDAAMGSSGGSKPSRISRKLHRERQRLVFHALCVFVSTAVHLPPTAWKVFHSKGDFLHNVAYKEVTHQGLMAPLAFTGNFILLLLNFHSHQIRSDRKNRMQKATFGSGSQEEGGLPPARRTGIRTLFLSQTDDAEISLQNVTEKTEEDGQSEEKYHPNYSASPPGYTSTSLAGIKIKQSTFSTTT